MGKLDLCLASPRWKEACPRWLPVWHRTQLNGNVTLRKLHQILQAAFGRTDSQLHEFEVERRTHAVSNNRTSSIYWPKIPKCSMPSNHACTDSLIRPRPFYTVTTIEDGCSAMPGIRSRR
ncbi:IS1096 element passenger TnpR family protein [Paraburkholderia dipogonis]|uniref:IS1096 element passenger TnpR family protein n=1 Tax=Paraburkholderia dipogonis TaxID=1211383 RepID=UPI0038BB545F